MMSARHMTHFNAEHWHGLLWQREQIGCFNSRCMGTKLCCKRKTQILKHIENVLIVIVTVVSEAWAFVVPSIPVTRVYWQTFILSSDFSKFHFPCSSVINSVSADLKIGRPAELAAKAITGNDDAKSNTLLDVVISNLALRAPLSSEQV